MRLLIAGGGTGGHLFPGIAVAEEARRRGGEVRFVGTARGLEARAVPAAGFPLETLDVTGLKRMGAAAFAKGLARLPRALWAARGILARCAPDAVLGVGGYASGPLVLAAALLRVPTAIQEQNSVPGFTNRALGRFVRRVFTAYDDAAAFFPARKVELVGNPIRAAFARAAPAAPTATAPSNDAATAPPRVLVLGGSQGARAVNDAVLGAAAILRDRDALPAIVHQAGAADEVRCADRYRALGLGDRAITRGFIDDMPAAYAAADLVVARAGALTLAELAATARPAILIPLPTAADDHQTRNARACERAGAAVVLPQTGATPAALADTIAALLAAPTRLAAMRDAAARLARPDAAARICDALERLAAPP